LKIKRTEKIGKGIVRSDAWSSLYDLVAKEAGNPASSFLLVYSTFLKVILYTGS
jgi:hypothetical protein